MMLYPVPWYRGTLYGQVRPLVQIPRTALVCLMLSAMTPVLLVVVVSASPHITSVTPVRFPREITSTLTVKGHGFVVGQAKGQALCAIHGLSGNFYSADLFTYNPMRELNAKVIDNETLECEEDEDTDAEYVDKLYEGA